MTASLVDRILGTLQSQASPPAPAAAKAAAKKQAVAPRKPGEVQIVMMKLSPDVASWPVSKVVRFDRDARGVLVGSTEHTAPALPVINVKGLNSTVRLNERLRGGEPVWATFTGGFKGLGMTAGRNRFINLVDGTLREDPPDGWAEAPKSILTIKPNTAEVLDFCPA